MDRVFHIRFYAIPFPSGDMKLSFFQIRVFVVVMEYLRGVFPPAIDARRAEHLYEV